MEIKKFFYINLYLKDGFGNESDSLLKRADAEGHHLGYLM